MSLSIPAKVFRPTAVPPNGAAIVVCYGTEGLNPPFGNLIDNDFCEVMANHGFVVARPEYFKKTDVSAGTASVMPALQSDSPQWVAAIVETVKWVQEQPGVTTGRVGLVGFSLGANQALHAASKTKVKAVVDFFGPIDMLPPVAIVESQLRGLPPVQIHHGGNDLIVPFSQSDRLVELLDNQGVSHQPIYKYPGQGHPGQPAEGWTAATQSTANPSVVAFLKANL